MTTPSNSRSLSSTQFLIRLTIWIAFIWVVSMETASSKSLLDPYQPLEDSQEPEDFDYYLTPISDLSIPSRPLGKRSPWAPTEVRFNEFLQRLRSRKLNGQHQMELEGRSATPRLDEKTIDLYGALMFLEGYQAARTGPTAPSDDDSIEKSIDELQRNGYGDPLRMTGATLESSDLSDAMQKRKLGDIRSQGEIHPVYLGYGQQAANSALNTFASLVAEEEKRLQDSEDLPSSPVRFIGKRNF